MYVGELKALVFLLLSLQIEAFSREPMRMEALTLAPRILTTLGEIVFFIHRSLWILPRAWLALNYFGLTQGPCLVIVHFLICIYT